MLLEGKKVSINNLETVKKEVAFLKEKGIIPTLGILRVGNNVGSVSYENSILNYLKPLGINIISIVLDENVTEKTFLEHLKTLNNDDTVDGILIFKPLPKQIDTEKVIYAISPKKDVDAMNPTNLGKLMINDQRGFFPCTAEGIVDLLDYYSIDVKGKDITIINNSEVIGKPLAILLTNRFATVSLCHEFTKNLEKYTKDADIVITAAGVPDLIIPEMLNENTILIDAAVTTKKNQDGSPVLINNKPVRVGDISSDCKNKVKDLTSITPDCGGGTGIITTSLLAKNILKAAKTRKETS